MSICCVYFFRALCFLICIYSFIYCRFGCTAHSAPHARRHLSCLVRTQSFFRLCSTQAKDYVNKRSDVNASTVKSERDIFRPVICQTADRYSEPECAVSPGPTPFRPRLLVWYLSFRKKRVWAGRSRLFMIIMNPLLVLLVFNLEQGVINEQTDPRSHSNVYWFNEGLLVRS